jgi:hypothetical protein
MYCLHVRTYVLSTGHDTCHNRHAKLCFSFYFYYYEFIFTIYYTVGLQRMNSNSPEVRALVQAMADKLLQVSLDLADSV